MPHLDFIDEIKIFVRAGNGGAGSRHFRRERHVPKGGPDGGDGGRGGHIFLKGNRNLNTLLSFRYQKHILAPHGNPGSGNRSKGANGKDILLEVPLGTIIKDEHGTIQGEVTEHQAQFIIAKGGQGGKGNTHFKSATNQAPDFAQTGTKGACMSLTLELKLIANIGLVGAPNAGKSTLLSVVSAARPKIGPYAFTTTIPNLGVVTYKPSKNFVMADIPGLIAGAAQGRGRGTCFLRHIERTKINAFMVSVEEEDIMQAYQMLQQELRAHNPTLLQKPNILVITKVDMVSSEELETLIKKISIPYICISSVTEKGILKLKETLWHLLHT
ncbi:MAG: GTPase ObgE [Cytophagales bacterium]